MTKGLEELRRMARENACCRCQYHEDGECYNNKGECVWKTIEKDLKTLETIGKYVDIRFERTNKGPVMWVRSKTLGQGWLIHISEEDYKDVGGTAREENP